GGAPVTQQPGLDVLRTQRFLQQRVVQQVDLPDGQVVRRTPPAVDRGEGRLVRLRSGAVLPGLLCGIGGAQAHRFLPRGRWFPSSLARLPAGGEWNGDVTGGSWSGDGHREPQLVALGLLARLRYLGPDGPSRFRRRVLHTGGRTSPAARHHDTRGRG